MAKVRWLIENGDIYYFGQAPKHINGVALNADKIEFRNQGETFQLVARAVPQGAIEQTDFTWASSNTSIATVNSNGLVTCVTPGSCTITVTTTFGGFTATCNVTKVPSFVDFLLVGGGGGGGGSCAYNKPGGGGGAGGFVEYFNYKVYPGEYCVVIGSGGTRGRCTTSGSVGGITSFNGICAYGGGGGGGSGTDGLSACGSGGGGGANGQSGGCPGGTSLCGQGNDGGKGCTCGGAGGGGAGCAGNNGSGRFGGCGGVGKQSCMSGNCIWYAGGGGGGSYSTCSHAAGGCGYNGCGGGGCGGQYCCCSQGYGWSGYKGVFILRYPKTCGYNITGGNCKYEITGCCVHCFTSDGTLTVN